jgi:L-ascorbate metabolism protein UlaG (beta-lactamase superfamily)
MKVKWLGHSCFVITADDGTKIITDPYATGDGINYGKINESADIVLISHRHADHNNPRAVKGNPTVITGNTKAKGMGFKGVASYHDTSSGRERGNNTIFCFTVDGLRVCHLGDLGHELSPQQVSQIGEVDILLIPVGGFFTIDAKVAGKVLEQLKPRVAIPMHYKTPKCDYPISGVEDFLKDRGRVKRIDGSEVEFKKGELPEATEVIVLKHAL